METKSVLICGVGGQGIILASEILSEALFASGYDVKKNEIHGMSQRGGSVVSFIRFGEQVSAPVPAEGSVELLFAFERLEAMRNICYLKDGGNVIVNDLEIDPVPVELGVMEYPKNFDEAMRSRSAKVQLIDAKPLAKEAGNLKSQNVVMLGALSKHLPEISSESWEKALRKMVKPKFIDVNLKAFELGKK